MWNNLLKYYKTFNEKQKKILFYFVVGFIFFFALLSSVFINIYESRSFMTNNAVATLSKAEAKEAIKILQKENIPISIEEDNGAISIFADEDVVEKAKITLITNSIAIKQARGWDLFDKDKFGKTRFENNIDYIRATEGEIELALESLDVITKAKVKAVFPKRSAFSKSKIEPQLSVVITPKNNVSFSQRQIDSIRRYLTGSLHGLKESNIQLLDSNGLLLEESNDTYASFEKAEKQSRWKVKQEIKLKEKIINTVAPMVGGIENVIAEVNINYIFSTEKTTEEKYDPKSKVIRSIQEHELKEKDDREVNANAGVPGVQSNLQNQNLQNEATKGSKSKKQSDTVTNYEVNKKIVDKINNTFAFIENIGVSVTFNSTPFKDKELEEMEKKIQQTVKSIVKHKKDRGDTLAVTSSKFFLYEKQLTSSQEIENVIDLVKDFFSEYSLHIKYVIVFLMLIAFYRFFIKTNSEIDLMEQSKATIEDDEDEVLRKRRDRAKKQKMLSAQLEEEEERQKELNDQLRTKVKKDLETIGGLSEEDELKFEVLLEELQQITVGKEEEMSILIENLESVLQEHMEE